MSAVTMADVEAITVLVKPVSPMSDPLGEVVSIDIQVKVAGEDKVYGVTVGTSRAVIEDKERAHYMFARVADAINDLLDGKLELSQ